MSTDALLADCPDARAAPSLPLPIKGVGGCPDARAAPSLPLPMALRAGPLAGPLAKPGSCIPMYASPSLLPLAYVRLSLAPTYASPSLLPLARPPSRRCS